MLLTLLKLVQSLVSTLHSEGTPRQIGIGLALGAALGLTPIANVHNLAILALLMVLNVSFGAGMLGWLVFTPVGFLLDPLFDRVGHRLLVETPALTPLWTRWYDSALMPWTNYDNTIVLGSFAAWLVLFVPIAVLGGWAVVRYRETWGARFQATRWYRAVTASKAYNLYRVFVP